jgi:hypothetical protein
MGWVYARRSDRAESRRSMSASRFTAGAVGFLLLIQCGEHLHGPSEGPVGLSTRQAERSVCAPTHGLSACRPGRLRSRAVLRGTAQQEKIMAKGGRSLEREPRRRLLNFERVSIGGIMRHMISAARTASCRPSR